MICVTFSIQWYRDLVNDGDYLDVEKECTVNLLTLLLLQLPLYMTSNGVKFGRFIEKIFNFFP